MKIPEIKKYIELFDTENYLFKVIGPNVKKRGYYQFDEFYKICMWKSSRQKQRYIRNKDTVQKVSKRAFTEKDERQKMEILCELEGVSVPTASALLTIVHPDRYAVIDVRCLETLKTMGCDIGKYPFVNNWIKYLKIMREWAKENGVTPRELDMALFSIHRESLEGQDYKNLYRK